MKLLPHSLIGVSGDLFLIALECDVLGGDVIACCSDIRGWLLEGKASCWYWKTHLCFRELLLALELCKRGHCSLEGIINSCDVDILASKEGAGLIFSVLIKAGVSAAIISTSFLEKLSDLID